MTILRLAKPYKTMNQSGPVNRFNDSASPIMVIKIYFNFFQIFLKVLDLIECRLGDPYMTTNRNFVRFTHS